MLTSGVTDTERPREGDDNGQEKTNEPSTKKCSSPVQVKRQAPIGPAMPPGGVPSAYADSEDDDDDIVGPALPGMKGFRPADERIEAEMARRALELKQAEWDRARGVTSTDAEKGKPAPLARQEWMTVMPESSFFKDSLAPANRPTGQPAAFRTYVLTCWLKLGDEPGLVSDYGDLLDSLCCCNCMNAQ